MLKVEKEMPETSTSKNKYGWSSPGVGTLFMWSVIRQVRGGNSRAWNTVELPQFSEQINNTNHTIPAWDLTLDSFLL